MFFLDSPESVKKNTGIHGHHRYPWTVPCPRFGARKVMSVESGRFFFDVSPRRDIKKKTTGKAVESGGFFLRFTRECQKNPPVSTDRGEGISEIGGGEISKCSAVGGGWPGQGRTVWARPNRPVRPAVAGQAGSPQNNVGRAGLGSWRPGLDLAALALQTKHRKLKRTAPTTLTA